MRIIACGRTALSTVAGLAFLVASGLPLPAEAENFSCSVPDSFCVCDGDKDSPDCKAMGRNCQVPNGMICIGGKAGTCWCDLAAQVRPGTLKMSHMPNVDVQSLTSTSGGAARSKPQTAGVP